MKLTSLNELEVEGKTLKGALAAAEAGVRVPW